MKRLGLLLLPVTMLVSACSSLHTVDIADRNAWVPEAHSRLAGGEATVILRHGETYSGTVVALAGDSLVFQVEDSRSTARFGLADVFSIRQPGNGTLVALGSLGGALIGAVVGAGVSAEEPDIRQLGLNSVSTGIVGGVVGLAVGAVVGGAITGAASRSHEYVIVNPRKSSFPPPVAAQPPDLR